MLFDDSQLASLVTSAVVPREAVASAVSWLV